MEYNEVALQNSIKENVFINGYFYVKNFLPTDSTEKVLELFCNDVILQNGKKVHQLKSKKLVSPQLATPNNYTNIYGDNAFPFHTDLAHWYSPPRYVVLRCVKGFETVSTSIIDGMRVLENVNQDLLSKILVQPRRPLNGKLPLLRLFQKNRGEFGLLRWDEIFIRPASSNSLEGFENFKKTLLSIEHESFNLASAGDMLIFDNWRMLHGRGAVLDVDGERIIDRAYLEVLGL